MNNKIANEFYTLRARLLLTLVGLDEEKAEWIKNSIDRLEQMLESSVIIPKDDTDFAIRTTHNKETDTTHIEVNLATIHSSIISINTSNYNKATREMAIDTAKAELTKDYSYTKGKKWFI